MATMGHRHDVTPSRASVIVDTSALVAIALSEPHATQLLERLHAAPRRRISVATLLEACLVLVGRLGDVGKSDLDALVRQLDLEIVPVDVEQGRIAQEAAIRFGRGRHAAALNYGDCFSYALATVANEPLLCVGDDFVRTDVAVA